MARRTKTDPPASPVPDTASPRKRRRWGLYIPFIIALVAVVAWTGVWIYAHAEAGRQIPTNRLAKMPAAMQQSLGNVDDLLHKVTVVDWTAINAHRTQWDTRWNRQIER